MAHTSTHTFATLPVSRSTYDEIKKKLKDAGYDHAFLKTTRSDDDLIDMDGIALMRDKDRSS